MSTVDGWAYWSWLTRVFPAAEAMEIGIGGFNPLTDEAVDRQTSKLGRLR
jgi:hypothetical protein